MATPSTRHAFPPSATTLATGCLTASLLATLPAAGLDLDANSYPDVWEARYHATALAPGADTDGDGQANRLEAIAGTDPRDAVSVFSARIVPATTGHEITFSTQPGKKYQLLGSGKLEGPWEPIGDPVIATGSTRTLPLPALGGTGFFHVSVTDHDADGDGLDDWSERQLSGFDPANPSSFPAAGGNDLATATSLVGTWKSGLTLEATVPDASEKENQNAILNARRAAAPYPLTIFLKTSGAEIPTKASATTAHYQPIPRTLVIPAGATSVTVPIVPIPNTLPEVPRQLTLTAGGSPATATFFIRDAANIPANQRLLLAHLRPLPGLTSGGSGLATLKVSGDNDFATASVSFSNLNSPVNSTQILTVSSSSILQSIPPANYGGQIWNLRATQTFTSDQAVLDALLSGQVKLGVYTQAHVTGEIEGTFQPVTGSIEFTPPPAATPVSPLANEELERDIARFLTQATFGPTYAEIEALKARVAAAGGDRIAAYTAWIDEQLALPSPSLLEYHLAANAQEREAREPDYNLNSQNRRRGWWLFAVKANSQLKQRFGFALSEIFVISDTDAVINRYSEGAASYHDILTEAATGRYRALLRSVSLSPAMGQYLSHLRNAKATFDSSGNPVISPDENYAREIMQLFSIGLVQLHPDGSLKLDATASPVATYTQADIADMARVFTGWSFSKRSAAAAPYAAIDNNTFNLGNGTKHREAQWTNPMKAFAGQHDTGAKTVLGTTLAAGKTAGEDLNAVLDLLRDHPNTAPFISRRLIQRLVTANPSPGYLYRVSQTFRTTSGDFPAVIKAILLDPEARSARDAKSPASAGKVREPLLRATGFMRAFGAASSMPLADLSAYGYPATELAKFPVGTSRYRLNRTPALAQSPLGAPSVFNWFLPDHSPSGIISANGLVSPELQVITESTAVTSTNFIYNGIFTAAGFTPNAGLPTLSGTPQRIRPDFGPLKALYLSKVDTNGDGLFSPADTATFNNSAAIATANETLLDRIDLLLTSGELKASFGNRPGTPRRIILDALATTNAGNNANTDPAIQTTSIDNRIKSALWLVMAVPQGVTQK